MSEQKHTPLPWAAPEFIPMTGYAIPGVAVFDSEEDAELARRAANTHYQLVAALEAALEAFDTGQRVSNESCGPFGAFKLPETDLQKQIRAALQAAKEQP